jgi:hypothetical protein
MIGVAANGLVNEPAKGLHRSFGVQSESVLCKSVEFTGGSE